MNDRQETMTLSLAGGLRVYARRCDPTPTTRTEGAQGTQGRPRSALLLHGLGDDHGVFTAPFLATLGERLTLLAPDLVGFGRTPAPAGFDFSLDRHADAMRRVLDTLPPPTVVIGHSLGGAIGAVLAAGAPRDRVAGLVSVEGNLTPADCFLSRRAIKADEHGKFDRWWRLLPATLEARGTVPRYRDAFRRTDPAAYLHTARALFADTTSGRLAELTCRSNALFIHGDTVAEDTRDLVRERGLPALRIDGAPHWVIEHAPVAVARAILDWVDGWMRQLPERD